MTLEISAYQKIVSMSSEVKSGQETRKKTKLKFRVASAETRFAVRSVQSLF